jgi:hypothetical protein
MVRQENGRFACGPIKLAMSNQKSPENPFRKSSSASIACSIFPDGHMWWSSVLTVLGISKPGSKGILEAAVGDGSRPRR